MFENDDWIFEDAFNEDNIEEETKGTSHSSLSPSIKRRKVDTSEQCKVFPSLPTDNASVRQLERNVLANVKDNNLPTETEKDVSRGDMLLGIFQTNTSQEMYDFGKEVENVPSEAQRKVELFQSKVNATSKAFQNKEFKENSDRSMRQVKLAKEVKLVRIFPGPAGLVKNDTNISAKSLLSNVEELEKSNATDKRIEIKSQSEKNLSEEKAWKFLLNDLPENFLQNYKISGIKDKANASYCDSTKVKFMAGMLEYIDHSHEDPFVILKDSTGSIEGTIHRDIPLTYPSILEPNVVILLHDVGLLKTTTYVVSNKYHILVSLVNLVAIYTDKGQVVSTSLMENILSDTPNIESNKINSCVPVSEPVHISKLQKTDKSCTESLQTSFSICSSTSRINISEPELINNPSLHLTNEKYKNSFTEVYKNDKNCKVTNKTFGHLNYSTNTDNLTLKQDIKRNTENSKALVNYFTGDNEGNKYDSDDEILSQLDVDNIFDKLKKDY
ncbi:hypothetical protein PUN28_007170 [Cardiocondyla obscurior]|uniref:Homologous recombination OB-fold protein OB-fold domain-containing protein n=1 Tax=Cardiocondyla obscurior TaxID=286306 RepID=A0AAW2G463_9HYME